MTVPLSLSVLKDTLEPLKARLTMTSWDGGLSNLAKGHLGRTPARQKR